MKREGVERVLIAHNAYRERGGEDGVVEHEAEILQDCGVDVRVEIIENEAISGLSGRAKAFRSASGNTVQAKALVKAVQQFGADVVHLHNFFPLISPSAHIALAQAGLPVVQTLHNYRLLCANGMLSREGQVCELCLTHGRANALRYRCYRGSLIGSAAVLRMQDASIFHPEWSDSVTRFIALTEFARQKFVAAGLPADKVVVKGNSVADPGVAGDKTDRNGALFVGRIAEGKGADLLCEAWHGIDENLTIIGDGPLLEKVKADAPPNVSFAGRINKDEVSKAMHAARWLVLPSTWYEGYPLVLAEAFAHGLPVVASRIGGIPEIVRDGETGLLFTPGNVESCFSALMAAFSDTIRAAEMGQIARERYEKYHNSRANGQALLATYQDALNERRVSAR